MGLLGRLTGKVRCPACSSFARHPLDKEREAEIRDDNASDNSEFGKLLRSATPESVHQEMEAMGIPRPGKRTVRAFVCGSCRNAFDLDTEMIWAKTAKQIGNEKAAAAYRELQEE